MTAPRKLRMAMVGGGLGSFIGDVHRKAAAMDGLIELCAGAFSSTPEKALASAKALGIPEARSYPDYVTMLATEAELPETERVEVVSIVTPNHMHFAPAKAALLAGFHVICDKPMTLTLDEATELEAIVASTGKVFALTHNCTSYPMVRQAKAMIAKGELGTIRKVNAHYMQGWLSNPVEKSGHKQASWRTDKAQSGIGGALGDIGTHAHNLVEFVTGMNVKDVCADLTSYGEGRALDDDGNVLLRFENGAKGAILFSQVATGEENDLGFEVYGSEGSLVWRSENPNELTAKWLDATKPKMTYTTAGQGMYPAVASGYTRLPAGHPEGFLEGFANVYKHFAQAVLEFASSGRISDTPEYPTVSDGVRGMKFIYKCVESSENNSAWTRV